MIILKKTIKNKSILSLFLYKLKGNRPDLPQSTHSFFNDNYQLCAYLINTTGVTSGAGTEFTPGF